MIRRGLQNLGPRKAVDLSSDSLVQTRPLRAEGALPLLVEPAVAGVDLLQWAEDHRDQVHQWLHRDGAVLFRGFAGLAGDGVAAFQRLAATISPALKEYKERSSSRTRVSDFVYTSTEYPADHPIFLHNENSYQKSWPERLFFYCAVAPTVGGETPIADCRRMHGAIAPEIIATFKAKGVMYLRNFNNRLGLPWQEVFQTDDRAVVEAHCQASGLSVEWLPDNGLRTRAVRPLVDRHPITGEATWFSHVVFFNVATFEPGVRATLEAAYAPEELPNHTYYGDGSPIEPEVIAHLQAVYRQEEVAFPWQQGDVLMIDNMLTAHGRRPFQGPRRILLAMA